MRPLVVKVDICLFVDAGTGLCLLQISMLRQRLRLDDPYVACLWAHVVVELALLVIVEIEMAILCVGAEARLV